MSVQLASTASVPSRSLAKPLALVSPHYDAIVVGSGYGGGVAAARLARAGRKVCVLERGRELRPGDFGSGLKDTLRELRLTGRRLRLGSQSGLFDFRVGRDLNVIVANGLGGGSLINGAVALRADPGTFARAGWPAQIAADGLMETAYARAERRLGVTPCPDARAIAKFQNLARCAGVIGAEVEGVPTTIRYSPGTNASNVMQYGCRLCGDCWSGCNVGAKTTVAVSYLVDAVDHGAHVHTYANVRHVARDGAGWLVHVADMTPGGHGPALRVLSADTVVLAAGTLGSTEILLRSREKGLALSDKLGHGFSGNGDEMFLGLDMPSPVNGVGVGFPPRADAPAVGPGTVGMIRVPAREDAGDGDGRAMLIQDGVMLPLMAMLAPLKALTRLQPLRAASMLRDGAYAGHRARTAMFYAVGEDDAAGRMTLDGDRLIVDWPRVAEQAFFKRGAEVVERMVTGLGGTFMPNPLSERMFGGRKVTVHPLGGCAMGMDAAGGVVDDACRVFDAASEGGRGVHAGLMVCDGSVLPGALGVNPLLTITALAERAMMLLGSREGWRPDDDAAAVAAPARDALM